MQVVLEGWDETLAGEDSPCRMGIFFLVNTDMLFIGGESAAGSHLMFFSEPGKTPLTPSQTRRGIID
jgi:hypothetical protein